MRTRTSTGGRRIVRLAAVTGLATTLVLPALAGPATAAPNNNSSKKLRDAVTADGVFRHLTALQSIANRNADNRASGTSGYDASRDYVAGKLRAAGYQVTVQPFQFPFFQELAPAALTRITPAPQTVFETGTFTFSGSDDVTAAVVPVDVNLSGTRASTSGCEAADFAGFPAGSIALLQRGTCSFATKALNAEAAGAAAAIVFNQGNNAGRLELIAGTLGGTGVTIPVIGLSFADGQTLASTPSTARVFTKTLSEERTTSNVIAESKAGDAGNVVMAGAHLDSVLEGPGMNDNGSGTAGLLEVALQMAKTKPVNKLRFAFWGAEELGLLGAEDYVAKLTDAQRKAIALYLNFDMIGSPNFVRFVYDGDDSQGDGNVGPTGSAFIEKVFVDYFAGEGLATDPTDFSGRSDYGPFIADGVGIPSGGLFTGAEDVKTAAQAARYGGTAGLAFDPNYHQAGDTTANINKTVLGQNADAIAHALITFAYSTKGVNGVPGNPGKGHTKTSSGSMTSAGKAGSQSGPLKTVTR